MKIERLVMNWIKEEYEFDVISRQQLFLKYLQIWFLDEYQGQVVEKTKRFSNQSFYKLCDFLIDEKVLMGFNHNTRGYTFFIKKGSKATSEMAISALYPLGYLSHMTAINLYAISKTKTTGIYFTCPERKDWKNLCLKEIKKNFKDLTITNTDNKQYLDINGLFISSQSIIDPYPHQTILDDAGSAKPLIIINKKNLVESDWWGQNHIQNIVDLYLDMLRTPHYCGGISHVLKIYSENLIHNKELFLEIVANLDRNGSIIDRARFGYIFNKILKLETIEIDKWKEEQKDKRGSSRKLFSNFKFDSFFDEDWNLSINHPTIKSLHVNLNKTI
jgi:hypothetical protein